MLPQSTVKASTAIASGSGFQLTKLGSWADSLLANRSVESGPRSWLIFWNSIGLSFHSDLSDQILDSLSAMEFNAPGKC